MEKFPEEWIRSAPAIRSALFVPGHRDDLFTKATNSGADGIILDLEDAVPETRRDEARGKVRNFLSHRRSDRCAVFVRINALDEKCLDEDLAAAVSPGVSAILIPKISYEDEVLGLEQALGRHERSLGIDKEIFIWPLLETARGVRRAFEISSCSRRIAYVGASVSRNGDLARALGVLHTGTFQESLFVRSKVLLDARAAGIVNPIGGVCTQIGDLDAVERDARFMRSLGYEGMMAIHPSQVKILNSVFSPSDADVAAATKLVREFQRAQKEGKGALKHQGSMIDFAHFRTAEALLKQAAANASRQSSSRPESE